MKSYAAAVGLTAVILATATFAGSHLPNLDGRSVVVVTENAYPPLQFVEPGSGDPVG